MVEIANTIYCLLTVLVSVRRVSLGRFKAKRSCVNLIPAYILQDISDLLEIVAADSEQSSNRCKLRGTL